MKSDSKTVKKREHYSDQEVISRILQGDEALYEILLRRYNPYLYKVGRGYGFNHHDTEDLMQESYIQAYYALTKFESRASFKTWLIRIMLNNCYHKKKKAASMKEIVSEEKPEKSIPMFHDQATGVAPVLQKELGRVIESAVTRVPEDYRMVFTLRELNGLSIAETAQALDISEVNVKVRLNRAKNLLRNEIEKMYSSQEIFEFNLVYCDRIVERVMETIRTKNTAGI
jgi:RNA polymerase sigma-70 factor (ECF subfamily)